MPTNLSNNHRTVNDINKSVVADVRQHHHRMVEGPILEGRRDSAGGGGSLPSQRNFK